ncbi:YafY family protein [Pseudoduganella ginsengisoli]|uniref:WYL domain-containing protein n=1 Tax=Pseudoduganella ginsengisoli TaxID=1462440 RepID=A0A6L6Q0X3_9BURK|nr:WYL domain-containing protein [Pseudoduganella ginsengisoli]MTW02682.1 WYL domain-containing protein [Pseudoduganella ginsengisoli]
MDTQRDIQRERLFYIDFLAFFCGQVARKDLVARFGISEPAATKDLSLYAETAPTMLEYDLRQRCYRYAGGTPHFEHDVGQALFSLSGERAIALDFEHAKRLPSSVQLSIKRQTPAGLVATLTRAIYQQREVSAKYFSLKRGAGERRLSPTAVVHDGLRWHVRCFDHNEERFKDYNLARFQEVVEGERSSVSAAQDPEWNAEVDVRLIAHPRSTHPETIQWDYDMGAEGMVARLRVCLVSYFLRHWHIDTTPNATKDPKEFQLFLKNREELLNSGVSSWVFDDDSESKNKVDNTAI